MYPIEAYQNARCLWYYMLSDEFLLQASTAGSHSVLPKINQKELSALTVHLPTNDREQEEIARILDELSSLSLIEHLQKNNRLKKVPKQSLTRLI